MTTFRRQQILLHRRGPWQPDNSNIERGPRYPSVFSFLGQRTDQVERGYSETSVRLYADNAHSSPSSSRVDSTMAVLESGVRDHHSPRRGHG